MTIEAVWTNLARDDLLAIYVAPAVKNPDADERVFDRLEQRAPNSRINPVWGRAEIRPTTRILVEAPCLILYETVPDADDQPVSEVEIVRVLDGRRDLGSLVWQPAVKAPSPCAASSSCAMPSPTVRRACGISTAP